MRWLRQKGWSPYVAGALAGTAGMLEFRKIELWERS